MCSFSEDLLCTGLRKRTGRSGSYGQGGNLQEVVERSNSFLPRRGAAEMGLPRKGGRRMLLEKEAAYKGDFSLKAAGARYLFLF